MTIIDIHTHGIGGYDTRTNDVEHLLKIAEIHGSYGVSEIILTVYPAPVQLMRESLGLIRTAMEIQASGPVLRAEYCNSKYGDLKDCGPARIIGAHLEGPFLNHSRCGSLNAMTFIDPTERNLSQLTESYEDIIRIITISPELDGSRNLIRRISDMGIIASMGHSDATYAETETGHKAGAKGITHIFNAMRPYHHREPGIIGYGLMNHDIYVEVIADPYHLHAGTLDLIFRVKNHERIIIVSDSIKATKIAATRVSATEGLADTHGKLLGGSMVVTEAVDWLAASHGTNEIFAFISTNPERYIYG